MRRSTVVLAAAAILLLPTQTSARFSKANTSSVVVSLTGPAGLVIEGKTDALDVSEANDTVKVVVPLAGLDTGIALRNKHMREKYLETSKFPTAELVAARAALQLPPDRGEISSSVSAQITIRGQTKPVAIRYQARRSGATYQVHGSAHVNMKDFGIDVPSYLGVTVKPDVEIVVQFSALDL